MPSTYTPREAAVVAGASLAAIQKAISAKAIPVRPGSRAQGRRIDETAVLAFALAEALPRDLGLSPRAAYRLLRKSGRTRAEDSGGEMAVGEVVRIDAGKALAGALGRLRLLRRAREVVTCDPAILGGTPVILGTRIPARAILGRLRDGEAVEDILEDYPYLDRETVEAAALYAEANPPRGRPAGRLWRPAS